MFLQIFILPITRYIFLSGAVINGLFVLFRGYPFMNVVWVALVGGFAFCGVWAGIIKILMILLSKQELTYFFNLSASSEERGYFDDDLDDDDLTMEELYNTDPPEEVVEHITSDSITSEYPAEPIDKGEEPEVITDAGGINHAKTEVVLNSPDQFQITVQGKTLKAHPRDGANAIRKAVYDDEHKN